MSILKEYLKKQEGVNNNPSEEVSNNNSLFFSNQDKINRTFNMDWSDIDSYTERGLFKDPSNVGYSEDQRALRQTGLDKWANGFGKMAVYGLATGINSTVGMVAGIGTASTGEAFWKNPINKSMIGMMEWADKAMPNYQTKEEQDTDWHKNMLGMGAKGSFANFWADTIIKNFGFTAGAVIAGAGVSGLTTRALMKISQKKLTSEFAKAATKNPNAIAKIVEKKGVDFMQKAMQDPKLHKDLLKELKSISSTARNIELGATTAATTTSVAGEAGIEAFHNYKDNLELFESMGYSPEDAERMSTDGGNLTFGFNAAILGVGNYSQFKSVLNPTRSIRNDFGKLIKGDIDRGYEAAKLTMKSPTWWGKVLKNPLIETSEEMNQALASEFSTNFVLRRNDTEASGLVEDVFQSFGEGFLNSYGDYDRWQEGFAGFFTGGVGMANINKLAGGKGPLWTGGVFETISEINQDNVKAEEHYQILNKVAEPIKKPYARATGIMSHRLEEEKAISANDKFQKENNEIQSISQTFRMFQEAGKEQDYLEFIEEVSGMSVEEIREASKFKNEEGILVEPNPNLSDKEVLDRHQKQIAKTKNVINKTKEITSQVDQILNLKHKDNLEKTRDQLVSTMVAMEFSENRFEEVMSEVNDIFTESNKNAGFLLSTIGEATGKTKPINLDQEVSKSLEPYTYKTLMEDLYNLVENMENPNSKELVNKILKSIDEKIDVSKFSKEELARGVRSAVIDIYNKNISENHSKVFDLFALAHYNQSMSILFDAVVNDPEEFEAKTNKLEDEISETVTKAKEEGNPVTDDSVDENDIPNNIADSNTPEENEEVKRSAKEIEDLENSSLTLEEQEEILNKEIEEEEKQKKRDELVSSKIKTISDKQRSTRLSQESILEEIEYLDTLLNLTLNSSSKNIDELYKKYQVLKSLYTSSTQSNTKKGRSVEKSKEQVVEDIKTALKNSNELYSKISDLKNELERLEDLKTAHQNHIKYLEGLKGKDTSSKNLQKIIDKKKGKLKTINKLINKLSNAVKRATSFLKEIVNYVFNTSLQVDNFVEDNNFRVLEALELKKLMKSKKLSDQETLEIYPQLKASYDRLISQLDNALDHLDLNEADIEKLEKEKDSLIKEAQKLDIQIDILEDLKNDIDVLDKQIDKKNKDLKKVAEKQNKLLEKKKKELEEKKKVQKSKTKKLPLEEYLTNFAQALADKKKKTKGELSIDKKAINKFVDGILSYIYDPQGEPVMDSSAVEELLTSIKMVFNFAYGNDTVYQNYFKKAYLRKKENLKKVPNKKLEDTATKVVEKKGGVSVDPTNTDKTKGGLKRHPVDVFRGLTGSMMPGDNLTENASQKRYFYFSQNNTTRDHSFQIIDITDEKANKEFYGVDKAVPEGFVPRSNDKVKPRVYVAVATNNKGEYIDMFGNPLEDQSKFIEYGVYSTLPEAQWENAKGTPKYYTPENYTQEDLQSIENEYIEFLKALELAFLEAKMNNQRVVVPMLGVARGIEFYEESERLSTGEYFSEVADKNLNIQVATDGTFVSTEAHKVHNVLDGHIYLENRVTGHLYPLQPKKLGELQGNLSTVVEGLIEVIDTVVNYKNDGNVIDTADTLFGGEVNALGVLRSVLNLQDIEESELNKEPQKTFLAVVTKNGKVKGLSIKEGDNNRMIGKNEDLRALFMDSKKLLANTYINVKNNSLEKNLNTLLPVIKEGKFVIEKIPYFTFVKDYATVVMSRLPQEADKSDITGNNLTIDNYVAANSYIIYGNKSRDLKVVDNNNKTKKVEINKPEAKDTTITLPQEKTTGETAPSVEDTNPAKVDLPKGTGKRKRLSKEEKIARLEKLIEKTGNKQAIKQLKELTEENKPLERKKGEVNKVEDLDKAKQWVEDKFGKEFAFRHFTVLNNVISNNLDGYFQDAMIYIFENATEGTTYHEAFHAVTQMFLTSEQRQKLYNEVRGTKKQFTLSNGIIVTVNENTSDTIVEEILAEGFREYEMTGKMPDYTINNDSIFSKLKKFFNRIIRFFKQVTKKRVEEPEFESKIQQLYSKISRGDFKHSPILNRNTGNFNREKSEEEEIGGLSDGLTASEAYQAMQDYHTKFVENLLNDNLYSDIIDINKTTAIYEFLNNSESRKKITDILYQYTNEDFIEELDVIEIMNDNVDVNKLDFIRNNLSRIRGLHDKYLNKLGLVATEKELESVLEDEEGNIVGKENTDGAIAQKSIEISAKKTVNNMVKVLASGIIRYNAEGSRETNHLGMNKTDTSIINILINKLANSQSLDEMVKNIKGIYNSDIARFKSFREVLEKIGLFNHDEILNSENPNFGKIAVLRGFFKSFANNKNNLQGILVGRKGKVTVFDSNRNSLKSNILDSWKSNYLTVNPSPVLVNGVIEQPKKEFKATSLEEAIEYFNKNFGSEFDLNVINLMYPDKKVQDNIISNINKVVKNYEGNIYNTNTKGIKNNLDYLLEIAAETSFDIIENAYLEGTKTIHTVTQNTFHTIHLNDLNKIPEGTSFEDATITRPYLKSPYLENSEFIHNYLFVNGIRTDKKIEKVIHRTTQEDGRSDTLTEYAKSSFPEQLQAKVQNLLSNKIHAVRAADNSIENLFSLDVNYINDYIKNRKFIDLFKNYLKDEIQHVIRRGEIEKSSIELSHWKKKKETGNLGVIISMIKKFGSEDLALDLDILLEGVFSEDADVDINTELEIFLEENNNSLTTAIENFFEQQGTEVEDLIIENKLIQKEGERFRNLGLPIEKFDNESFPSANTSGVPATMFINPKQLKLIGLSLAITEAIGNIEQTKLFTGNPIDFKTFVDFYKRQSGLAGTKMLSDVSPTSIQSTNKQYKRLDGKVLNIEQPAFSIDVREDVEGAVNEAELKELEKIPGITKEMLDVYRSTDNKEAINTADAMSWGSMDFLRTFSDLQGLWNPKKEQRYQYEMQSFMLYLINNPKYSDLKESLTERFFETFNKHLATPNKLPKIAMFEGKTFKEQGINIDNLPALPSLKPQYYGPLQSVKGANVEVGNENKLLVNDDFIPVFWKTSVFNLTPSVFINFKEKTTKFPMLEEMAVDMMLNQKDAIIVESASKAQSVVNSMSDKNGKLNSNTTLMNLYYKFVGTQLELTDYLKDKIATGTQSVVHIMADLFDSGEFSTQDPTLQEASRNYLAMNSARINVGVQNLKEELGITETSEDESMYGLTQEGLNKLEAKLVEVAKGRDASENEINRLRRHLVNGKGIDFLANKTKIEQILSSIANKAIKTKRLGVSNAQVSEFGFTTNTEATIAASKGQLLDSEGNVIKTSELRVYSPQFNKDGSLSSITGMEIYLPSHFKGKFKNMTVEEINKMDKRLLSNILGYRIPTQGLNSIDFFEIKGFLDPAAGNVVVVPSMLIGKTGSDFDIDKLNIYFPNYDVVGGELKYIEYKEEKDSDDLFARYLKNKFKTEAKDELTQIVSEYEVVDDIENLEDNILELAKGTKALSVLEKMNERISKLSNLENYKDTNYYQDFLNSTIDKQNGIEAIENKMIEEAVKIISHPENFVNLIQSIDSDLISDTRNEILYIAETNDVNLSNTVAFNEFKKKIKEGDTLDRLLSFGKNMQKTKDLIQSKGGVGLAADHSKSHVLFQKYGVRFSDIITIKFNRQEHLVDSTLPFPTATNNLSAKLSSDNETMVSMLLNYILSGFVDGAKDPMLIQLNITPNTAPVALMLIRSGVDFKDVASFFKQPLIEQFIKTREIYESQNAEVNDLKLFRDGKVTYNERLKKFEIDDSYTSQTLKDYFESKDNPLTNEALYKTLKTLEGAVIDQVELDTNLFTTKSLYKNLNKDNTSDQSQIVYLATYIKLMEMGKALGEVVQATKFDTKGMQKDGTSLDVYFQSLVQVMDKANFINLDKYLAEGSFITPYKNGVLEFAKAFVKLQPLFNSKNNFINEMYSNKLIELLDKGKSKDDIVYTLNKMKSSFITYMLMRNEGLLDKGQELLTDLNNKKKSFPRQFIQFLNENPEYTVLKDYFNIIVDSHREVVDGKPTYTDGIKLKSKRLEAIDKDMIATTISELYNAYPQVAINLVQTTFLQSGFQSSFNSYHEILPEELLYKSIDKLESLISDEMSGVEETYINSFKDFYHSMNISDKNVHPIYYSRQGIEKIKTAPPYVALASQMEINSSKQRRDAIDANKNLTTYRLFKYDANSGTYLPVNHKQHENNKKQLKSISIETNQNDVAKVKPIKVKAAQAELISQDTNVGVQAQSVSSENKESIKRNFIELENVITDFEPEVQNLFNNPTVEGYLNAVGNYEFDLSADLPSKELRKKIESLLRDVKNSFEIINPSKSVLSDISESTENVVSSQSELKTQKLKIIDPTLALEIGNDNYRDVLDKVENDNITLSQFEKYLEQVKKCKK